MIGEQDIPPRSEIRIIDIRCHNCQMIKSLKVFRKSFIKYPYICISCVKRGGNNPFYGKHHTNESKSKMGGAVIDYSKENNPFYGKQHSNETIKYLKTNPKCYHYGNENPFYGKHHTEKTKIIITEKNKKFRKTNPEKILFYNLLRIGKTKEDFEMMLNDYVLPGQNRTTLSKKYNVDFRTMKSYWLYYNMIEKKDLQRLTKYKQLYSNPSSPELKLYDLLKNIYGEENVLHCYELKGYYYDICMFGKILIEYDGYYWHKILKNNNDNKKTNIAVENGYLLYRVEEMPNRKSDISKEIENIKSLLETNKSAIIKK